MQFLQKVFHGISHQIKPFFTAVGTLFAISWAHWLAKCLWHQGLSCHKPSGELFPVIASHIFANEKVCTYHQYFANAWHGRSTPAMDCKSINEKLGLDGLDISWKSFLWHSEILYTVSIRVHRHGSCQVLQEPRKSVVLRHQISSTNEKGVGTRNSLESFYSWCFIATVVGTWKG